MPRWSLAPVTGDTAQALKDSLNQRLVDLDLILGELEQVEQQVKGQGGYTAQMSGPLDMQGHRLMGLPDRPRDRSDACSWRFHQSGDFLYSESNTFSTDKRIEHQPAVNVNGSVTLDQLLAILAQQFAHQVPAGIIVLWKGSTATIPVGWHLCDGTAGTEDLRDVFIPGAGGAYAVNATGGADTVNLAHAHTADGTLAAANESAHPHGDGTYATGTPIQAGSVVQGGAGATVAPDIHTHDITGASSVGSAHGHDVTGSTDAQLSAATENRPRFYAKAYIQKL